MGKATGRGRAIHQWPPLQQGEARVASTRRLWRYISQHQRWMRSRDPMSDNYLALHRVDSALTELTRRAGGTFPAPRNALSSLNARDTLVQSRNRRNVASRVLPAFADLQTEEQSGERK